MLKTRVIPVLLNTASGLVKTTRFRSPRYVGDPINAVRVFNEKEVNEIVVLDIDENRSARGPNYELIEQVASECFMPMAYGGGISSVHQIQKILALGVEKVVLCTAAAKTPDLVRQAADLVGSQSVVVCIDVKKSWLGGYRVVVEGGSRPTEFEPVSFARQMENLGCGELMVNSIDRDGTMTGYDIELLRSVSDAVTVPLIACGGAGSIADFAAAIKQGGASAVAAGSFFVFYGKHRAVLISYPEAGELDRHLC